MKTRVFLADDHQVVRDGLRLIIEAEGDLEVIGQAGDGREAVRLIGALKPDLAIVDIAMPGLDGIEVIEQVRKKADYKIIVLSMHAASEQIYRALRAGVRGYLLKESAGSEVVDAIRAVLAGKRYLSGKVTEVVVNDYAGGDEKSEQESPFGSLSSREREVLRMVAEGKRTADIADILSISPKTVETYRRRIMLKLGVSNLASLMKLVLSSGLPPTKY